MKQYNQNHLFNHVLFGITYERNSNEFKKKIWIKAQITQQISVVSRQTRKESNIYGELYIFGYMLFTCSLIDKIDRLSNP